jgi:hypothetical protein
MLLKVGSEEVEVARPGLVKTVGGWLAHEGGGSKSYRVLALFVALLFLFFVHQVDYPFVSPCYIS